MSSKTLYANITNTSDILKVQVSDSHVSAVSTANILCKTTSLGLGDTINIDLGYVGNNGRVFSGFVKAITRTNENDDYSITAHNDLSRAVDYFIVSSDPESPISKSNIEAEFLVRDILAEAGLTDYTYDATDFTFGILGPIEINLISSYDFCRQIANILSWNLWADVNGLVHFENRKPYVMDGTSGQPGDTADTPEKTITKWLELSNRTSEKDLRNRVVVYGRGNISAVEEASSPYLPAGFKKSVVLASELIDSQSVANKTAEYNLDLLNRLDKIMTVTIEGDHELNARDVITLNDTVTEASGDWYIFTSEHAWSSAGYTTLLELRQ